MAVLCSLLLLLSAFLLFSIQPMVAKMLLPILGGSPSVWNTAMVFYQAALLGGYFYSHVISKKLSFKSQLIVHGAILALPAVVLPLYYGDLHPPGGSNPIPWMLLTMALSVGLPFFVLSASSPLIQSWFSRAGYKDPYFLYAASNVGSFLGLLSYPFLIEPRLTVAQQSGFWTVGYILLAVLFVITALKLRREIVALPQETEIVPLEPLPWKRRLRWVFLAFIPSSQFIGVTTYLTTDIAVMPLLWVIPLAIYLLTMVFVFAKKPPIPHKWILAAFPYVMAVLVFITSIKVTLTSSIFYKLTNSHTTVFSVHLIALFVGAMLCHGELAKDRPTPGRLTEFFLWMSLGGVLGGMFNALVAPNLFVQVIEYTMILVVLGLALPAREPGWKPLQIAKDIAPVLLIGGGTVLFLWLNDKYGRVSVHTYRPWLTAAAALGIIVCASRPLRFAMGVLGMAFVSIYNHQTDKRTLYEARSFFGVQKVEELGFAKSGLTHILVNGRILHGRQVFTPELEKMPLSYYHSAGPLKEVFEAYPRPANSIVGVVGLGVGSTAAWSRPGEDWTFYEIDELVEKLARDNRLFTYLSKAAAPQKVVIGDARLKLAEEPDAKFDFLLIDAFSSDAIPAHLMTVEAFQLYRRKLKPNGLLAVHISNRYLDLEPLVAAAAEELGLKALYCEESGKEIIVTERGRELANWCVVGPKSMDCTGFDKAGRWEPAKKRAGISAWTDEFSSLLPLMDWR